MENTIDADVSVQSVKSSLKASRHKKPGRPMTRGKVVYSATIPGGIGVFVGCCEEEHKVLITIKDAEELARQYFRERNTYFVRLLQHLMKLRNI